MESSARTRPLNAQEGRELLFLRAVEELDSSSERITVAERSAAGRAFLNEPGTDFLKSRAARILSRVPDSLKSAASSFQYPASKWPRWLPLALPAGAFLLGWFSNELGAERRVSLLAFPLLGLIVWNLAVCLASLISALRSPGKSVPLTHHPFFPPARIPPSGDPFLDSVHARADREWHELQAPVLAAKGKLLFHICAILLAAGVVTGMYARGMVRAYQAGWESTFLTQSNVSTLTRSLLGPASRITRIPVPPVPSQGEVSPAAPWIHLWSATAALLILVPRLLLVSSARKELRKASPDWNRLFAKYESACRLLASGQPLVARILPVQCHPDSKLRDSLRAILQHLWGGQVIVDFQPGVEYGDEDECLENLTQLPSHLVLLLPMAVTPEHEVHGVLAQGLQHKVTAHSDPVRALVVLDGTVFESRLQGMPERVRRMTERVSAWKKVLGSGLPVLVLDESAQKSPAQAAASVAAAREPVRPWTGAA